MSTTPKDEKGAEPAAYFYRFHTDDSLAGKPNVRPWVLAHGQPTPGLYKECEIRLLYAPGELDSAREALREAAENLDNFAWSCVITDGPESFGYLSSLLQKLRAALASLKGEAP